jgi:exopolyphosphatase / guanosine-5'-triphosphate,3'-diphosphate pyrophosphatase
MTRRVGAVDIGTNSTRLLVADVSSEGGIAEVERLLQITRLGDRVDTDHRLGEPAMARVHAALDRYAARAAQVEASPVLAVATSAVRDAENGADFLKQVGERHGFVTRLLAGTEEAELTYRGVCSRTQVADGTLICDIGGGSTELILGGPEGVRDRESLDIGCVRLSERHLHTDPPTADELAALRAEAASALPERLTGAAAALVGVAGTVTTLATIDMGLEAELPEVIDGHELAAETASRLLSDLAALPLERRRLVRGLMPERAPTIVAGAAILATILAATGLDTVTVSERDILHGAALAAAEL